MIYCFAYKTWIAVFVYPSLSHDRCKHNYSNIPPGSYSSWCINFGASILLPQGDYFRNFLISMTFQMNPLFVRLFQKTTYDQTIDLYCLIQPVYATSTMFNTHCNNNSTSMICLCNYQLYYCFVLTTAMYCKIYYYWYLCECTYWKRVHKRSDYIGRSHTHYSYFYQQYFLTKGNATVY